MSFKFSYWLICLGLFFGCKTPTTVDQSELLARIPAEESLGEGVTYKLEVIESADKPQVIHTLEIDLTKVSMTSVVSSFDAYEPMKTSTFAEKHATDIAINANFFQKRNKELLPIGTVVSGHKGWGNAQIPKPELNRYSLICPKRISPETPCHIEILNNREKNSTHFNVVTGWPRLVTQGKSTTGKLEPKRAARTAIGFNEDFSRFFIVVCEGPRTTKRIGFSFNELSQHFIKLGATTALALDGGSSSTLVLNRDGTNKVVSKRKLMNPTEASVPVHLGFIIDR